MNTIAPPIYMRVSTRPPMRTGERVLALLIAGMCLAVLTVAVRLTPNRAGVGTHQALGLAPCGWLERTGIPCPACGMTTSFARLVHGHVVDSLYVQPMGTLLALMAAMTFWVGSYIGITGTPLHRVLMRFPAVPIVLTLFVLTIAAWAWKIWIHLHGIDGFR